MRNAKWWCGASNNGSAAEYIWGDARRPKFESRDEWLVARD